MPSLLSTSGVQAGTDATSFIALSIAICSIARKLIQAFKLHLALTDTTPIEQPVLW